MPKKTTAEMRAKAAEMRAEAARIEAEELKAERLTLADKIPTCPACGGRSFNIYAWTTVAQSAHFLEDPELDDDGDIVGDLYDWGDDYESGDHTDQNESATCNDCHADVQEMLEQHGWTFYADPQPLRGDTPPSNADADAALATLRQYFTGSASSLLVEELQGIKDDNRNEDESK